jgi:hypothetical protein
MSNVRTEIALPATDQDASNQKAGKYEEQVHAHPHHPQVAGVAQKYHRDCNHSDTIELANSLFHEAISGWFSHKRDDGLPANSRSPATESSPFSLEAPLPVAGHLRLVCPPANCAAALRLKNNGSTAARADPLFGPNLFLKSITGQTPKISFVQ